MPENTRPSIVPRDLLLAWTKVLSGHVPILSIEITRECPLSCPGCYAYGDAHLGSNVNLRQLTDFRGDALVQGVLGLVRQHCPLQVSLVGGEPLMRRKELDIILPALSKMQISAIVVTSAVIPIPLWWMKISQLRIAVSVDGLPEHHDIRRNPATYERILRNVEGRRINVHWVITKPMLDRPDYMEEYVRFWSQRPEVDHIWVSLYTPQSGEQSAEMLSHTDRERIARELPSLRAKYPKLLVTDGIGKAFVSPPQDPQHCLFSKLSVNYSADLKTRVEPCVFGGTPDCSQCGCSVSSAMHWIKTIKIAGPVTVGQMARGSLYVGRLINKVKASAAAPVRWDPPVPPQPKTDLVQIEP